MTPRVHPRQLALAALLSAAPLAATAAAAAPASAAEPTWRFAPALAPAPPPGAAPAPYRVALGRVGDIEFWAPNRGVLITEGTQTGESTGVVPKGVYAYDGVDWHQLSTVCGGTDGRIAWAGPEEFWTIADQRPGQVTSLPASLANVSLCRFKEGRVVASYAMPLEQPDSYRPLNAAACRAWNDCWFAGAKALPPARGAFHLHWNGETVRAILSPRDHAVADLAAMGPQLFESLDVRADDDLGGGDPDAPVLFQSIAAPGAAAPFRTVVPSDAACEGEVVCPPLPEYGSDASGNPVAPATLAGFSLSSDWILSGSFAGAPQLWAVAGRRQGADAPPGRGRAHPIVLRLAGGAWTQVVPRLAELPAGADPVRVAAEPGRGAAWIALDRDGDETGRVVRVTGDGELGEPVALGPDQGVGERGPAGPIACPAPGDCWAATERGWLFHLTDGTPLLRDASAAFAGVITYRPPDGGVPFAPPDDPPVDDSLANQRPLPPGGGDGVEEDPQPRRPGRSRRPKPLVRNVRTLPLRGTTLRMTFTLTARARVQLVALRRGKPVARTPRRVMRPGKQMVRLKLDRKRWPTRMDLRVRPVRSGGR